MTSNPTKKNKRRLGGRKAPNQYPLPLDITDERWGEIARLQDFNSTQSKFGKQWLALDIEVIRSAMSMRTSRRTPRQEIVEIRQLLKPLDRLRAKIAPLSPGAREIVNNALGTTLLAIVSIEHWKREFPALAARGAQDSAGLREFYGRDLREDEVLQCLHQHVAGSSGQIFSKLLLRARDRLQEAIARYTQSAKGGGQSLVWRNMLLEKLAQLYELLGRSPTTTTSSGGKFLFFAIDVLDAVGWPTIGVEDAIYDAVLNFRLMREIQQDDASMDAAEDDRREAEHEHDEE